MKTLLASLALLFVTTAFAGGPAQVTDLKAALKTAQKEGKLLFVQLGREACGNCQALKGMIAKQEVPLAASKYVYADVNCDDAKTIDLFTKRFQVEGTTLPFVVVAAPDGTQLAARSGSGRAKDYNAMLRVAQAAAEKLASGKNMQKK